MSDNTFAPYRNRLPQLDGGLFLTDGGIETTLIFHEGFDLPYFAAFVLLESDEGTAALKNYFRTYAHIAQKQGTGFILESATWRSSADWGEKIGYSAERLANVNRRALQLLFDIRAEFETDQMPIVVSGCVGPQGDGYVPENLRSIEEAEAYHTPQITTFRDAGADMITAITMNNVEEAVGLTRAAQKLGMPVVISFTVETDGTLPTGQPLKEALELVDQLTTNGPAYYMINCAHPTHFESVVSTNETWVGRIRGLRANASSMSHAELDAAEELDDGNPEELGAQYRALKNSLPNLNVLGGCCGTDHRHIEAIGQAFTAVS